MLTTVPFKSVPGLDTPVTEVMHHRLIAMPPTASLADVAATMHDSKVHAVLIADEDAGPTGWVTSRGLLHNHCREWAGARAADAITEPATSVPYTATISDAMTAFVASGASHVLVASPQSDIPSGVIADSDLVAFMARREPPRPERWPSMLNSILARDAMHAPIVACGPATELDQVAKLMASHRVHAVVVDGIVDDHLVWGVVSDLDLIRAQLNEFAPANAGQASRTEALTVDAGDDLAVVSRRLVEHACSHAIVVENDVPAGVISTLDIAAALAAE